MRLGVCKNSAVLSAYTCITFLFSDQNLFGYTADIITDRANKDNCGVEDDIEWSICVVQGVCISHPQILVCTTDSGTLLLIIGKRTD